MTTAVMMKERLSKATSVLDLWCGTGFYSILAASYGCEVVAVDNESMKKFSASPYLYDHPRINFVSESIEHIERYIRLQYDYIIIKNVLMFLDRDFVLDRLLPSLIDSLLPWWYIYLTYFDNEDYVQNTSKNIKSVYTISDFEHINTIELVDHSHEIFMQQDYKHSIHNIFLKKEA